MLNLVILKQAQDEVQEIHPKIHKGNILIDLIKIDLKQVEVITQIKIYPKTCLKSTFKLLG